MIKIITGKRKRRQNGKEYKDRTEPCIDLLPFSLLSETLEKNRIIVRLLLLCLKKQTSFIIAAMN